MTAPQRSGSTEAPPRPVVTAPPAWQFPTTSSRWLEPTTGARLHTAHLPGQHVLAVRVGIAAPVSSEPQGQEGIGLLVARCLDLGTSKRDADEIAVEFERRGIAFGCGVGERGLYLDLDLTAEHLSEGLDLLSECFLDAQFPEDEVRRQVRSRLADISHERADAASRAATEFLRVHYAADQRAAVPIGGTSDSVATLDRAALRAYHGELLVAGPREISVVGDLDVLGGPDAVEAEVARALRAWPTVRSASPLAYPAARVADTAARVVLIDRPEAVQSEIYLGRPGPDRRDPRGWSVFQTLSMLMGGSPRARLDAVLREQRGYTYGVSAGFRSRAAGGLFVVSMAVRTEVTADALGLVLDLLAVTGAEFTDAEVRRHADYVAHTAPARYGTADVVAEELLGLAMDGLGPEFVTDNLAFLQGLDARTVGAAWDDVMHSGRAGSGWTIVVVGNVKGLERQLGGWSTGQVSVVRADG